MHTLPHDAPVTPGWLTAVLRASGALPTGEVTRVTLRENTAFNSAALHLEAVYSSGAPASAPSRLFLKRNIPAAWAAEAGVREVAFYQMIAPHLPYLPMIVPCYGAEADKAAGQTYCLLLDVSDTHDAPFTRDDLLAWRGVPSSTQLDQVVDTIAAFHAYWWEHPALGATAPDITPWYRTRALWDQYLHESHEEWASFIAAEGDWFPTDLRALYERILAGQPAWWDRYLAPRVTTHRNLTLSHCDGYLSQYLCPRNGISAPTYLIDFQGPKGDFCSNDLVHLFATFWTQEQRHQDQRELRCLRRYHAALQAHGVRGYSWDQLLDDYRLMLICMLQLTVWDQTNGSARSYWWPKMQCLVAAYRDHDAGRLLA